MSHHRMHLLGIVFLALALMAQPAVAQSGVGFEALTEATLAEGMQRVSVGTNGLGGGSYASISANGRYVIFESYASDLLPGQVDDSWDVIAHDLDLHTNARISTRSDGSAVYNTGTYTSPPAVSSSGRYVAFVSGSDSLVPDDTNGMPDIFLRDRTGCTMLVSVGMDGEPANAQSFTPAVSDDGRYVAFQSMASNLAANDNNEEMDLFLRDMQSGKTWPISITSSGKQGSELSDYGFPSVSISGSGRYVAFSYQYLPVDNQPTMVGPSVYLYDHQTKTTTWVSYGSMPTLSTSGQLLLFVTTEPLVDGDNNESQDVYLLDRATDAFERVSLHNSSAEAAVQGIYTPAGISDDGRFVVFESTAALVSDVSEGAAEGPAQIYLRDRQLRTTTLITRGIDGGQANDESHHAAISGDGRVVVFNSMASNLVENDGNGASDVFVLTLPEPSAFVENTNYYMPLINTH